MNKGFYHLEFGDIDFNEEFEILKPHSNLITGETAFIAEYGEITSLERDVLNLASMIYAVDVAHLRGERELYTRSFQLSIPVVNIHAFQSARDELEHSLYLLTNDNWELQFVPVQGEVESYKKWDSKAGTIILFSGGLDSLAQAVIIAEKGENALLVSHDSGNPVVLKAQKELYKYLRSIKSSDIKKVSFRVRGQKGKNRNYPNIHESSQRSRSFLFLSLASLVARRSGFFHVILMAENGQLSIHLPITAARIGAFSTRTAHPEVLGVLQNIFSNLLHVDLTFENPFLYKTKAEVVRDLCKNHQNIINESTSCWKASRIKGAASHCGICIPCILRRIALEYWGIKFESEWARNLFNENVINLTPNDEGKRNMTEYSEFSSFFLTERKETEYVINYPELVNKFFDLHDAINLYKRAAKETEKVFRKYKHLRSLIN
ncbi:MAG: 7-cyano-7-deazaguanine synthase [Promethearchaeota archaeon]